MALLVYIGIGVVIGAAVGIACRVGVGSSMAVGCLGALLGRASAGWLGAAGQELETNASLAALIGAVALAAIWTAARRLFLSPAQTPSDWVNNR